MRRKKKLDQLTIKDNFMFGAVMCDEKNCRRFLEMIFGFPIARVEVSKEKSLIYHPELNDESISIFLSTKGKNVHEVPDTMVEFLKYVGSDLQDSEDGFGDEFVKSLQESVASIKASREMESKYMTLQEMLKDEHRAGRSEILQETKDEIFVALSKFDELSDNLRKRIESETNQKVLMNWYKAAITSATLEEFEGKIK